MADVELLAPDLARDEALVEALAHVVNAAYAIGEAGLWHEGTARARSTDIAEAIRAEELLAATLDGRVVGCAYVHPLDTDTADLGLISVAPDLWGSGIGSEIVRSAEAHARSRGVTSMQLELLVPTGWTHPAKERLRAWYTRLGYRPLRTAPFDQVAAHLASRLATPCEFVIFRKPLAEPRDEGAQDG